MHDDGAKYDTRDREDSNDEADDVVIQFKDVHKAFADRDVLRGINMSVKKGHTAVVLGGSGSGKSVFLKHIVRLLVPDRGEVWVEGERVDHLEDQEEIDSVRLKTGYLFQGGALFDSMSVFENMSFLLERHSRMDRKEREEQIMKMLEWVNLSEKAGSYPAELSGGQKKRIGLARALILEPHILLYDEPTTGLDPVSVRSVSDLIVRLQEERNITSVAITHDLLCAEIIADEVYFLHDGEFIESGTLDDVRQSNHEAIKQFFGDEKKASAQKDGAHRP